MVDTAPSFALLFNAEPPPSRSPSPSWNFHAGGLSWPEVNGQRDQGILKPAGDHAERVFSCVAGDPINPKKSPNKENNEQPDN
jgi:hypothetical protein